MDIRIEDFPVTADFNWQEIAERIGIEETMWFLDNWGGGDRKHLCNGEAVRRNTRKRQNSVPRDTAESLP